MPVKLSSKEISFVAQHEFPTLKDEFFLFANKWASVATQSGCLKCSAKCI
jgi:hypothetical protein